MTLYVDIPFCQDAFGHAPQLALLLKIGWFLASFAYDVNSLLVYIRRCRLK